MSVITIYNNAMLMIIFFIFIVLLTYFYFQRSWLYWKLKNVECPLVKFPFGNAQNVLLQKTSYGEEMARVYMELRRKCLRYGGYYFLTKHIFVPVDIDLVKAIMSKDFQHFHDHGDYLNEERDPLSGNLFSLKGQKWKNIRSKLTPTFTSGKMKMMFQTLVDCTHGLITVVDKCTMQNKAVDIKDVFGRFTTDVIGSCAFGIECNTLRNPNSDFRKYGSQFFNLGVVGGLIDSIALSFPRILDYLNIGYTPKEVSEFFLNIVNETVHYRETNNIVRKDFMHLLIQLKNNVNIQEDGLGGIQQSNETAGTTLTMNELAAQAFLFFIAGFETTSTTLTFCFYELATNLEIQQKLRDEINGVLAKHDSKITSDALKEMVFMDKCIEETLRKYPPLPLLNRECTKTYQVPDSELVIEKGTQVFIPLLGIQRDPEYYDDPLTFDPERFTPENKSKRHPFSWLPFGEGPRACIGLRFGLMQAKVALTVMLRDHRYTLNPQTKLPLQFNPRGFVISTNGGVWLNAERITQ